MLSQQSAALQIALYAGSTKAAWEPGDFCRTAFELLLLFVSSSMEEEILPNKSSIHFILEELNGRDSELIKSIEALEAVPPSALAVTATVG